VKGRRYRIDIAKLAQQMPPKGAIVPVGHPRPSD
jgi:hypothetical protein